MRRNVVESSVDSLAWRAIYRELGFIFREEGWEEEPDTLGGGARAVGDARQTVRIRVCAGKAPATHLGVVNVAEDRGSRALWRVMRGARG
jgi:hypothetical protein